MVALDQPLGERQLQVEKPGADRPLEGGGRHAEHAVDQRQRLRGTGRGGEVENFGERRAQAVADRIVLAGAAAAGVAVGGAGHAADVDQRRAVDRRIAVIMAVVAIPGGAVDLVVEGRELGENGENPRGRTQVAAPDALLPAKKQADGQRGNARSAKDQQGRLRVFIDADQLPIDGGADEGDERPAHPFQPGRRRPAQAVPAAPFGERAFRTEQAAPDAAHRHRGDHHAGPPDAPEAELREQAQVVPDVRAGGRQRHENGNDDQRRINDDDTPLHGQDGALMAAQKQTQPGDPAGVGCGVKADDLFSHARAAGRKRRR